MSRRYTEQIEVRLGEPLVGPLEQSAQQFGPVPTAFIWRGRLHVVRAVLSHWTQRLPWWRLAWSDEPGVSDEPDVPRTEQQERADLEQDVWRVEASAGRTLGIGVYDLARDEQWRLLRVAD